MSSPLQDSKPHPDDSPTSSDDKTTTRRRKAKSRKSKNLDLAPQHITDDAVDSVSNTLGSVANTTVAKAGGGGGSGKSDTLRLRLDLNLDIEITLKAKIHGDLELALLTG
ncbi:hypothetical protein CDD81_2120 [Ophiocordyceps australis]|uniref:Uncharacterized protein n=1 Tax=Ophiocordyceps australis TaxID=1399860 RepID=A0A2C5XEX7_9HYPO|nr:hypothetical protein CDD81_2120 [Ophiocordyceps australis]